MFEALDFLRDMTLFSVCFRLLLAMLFGGLIGIERERKRYPAGFRTYMIVCLGAALTMILSQYEYLRLYGEWRKLALIFNLKLDISRYSAQVINGIGFLGAGTILVNRKQEVKGLTTAASLWASACMGLAIGAGFYECVALGFLLIFSCNSYLPAISDIIVETSRNMNIFVEFSTIQDIRTILGHIRASGIKVYEVELERGHKKRRQNPNAIVLLQLKRGMHHSSVLSMIAELECVKQIEEI